jgi:glycosyltransferase involved in cell wall biosynthesis
VTTNVGALAEAVTHGETGWVVPPDDPGALAEALGALASDPARRARLSASARAVGRARFDAARNYGRLLDAVRSVGTIPA